MQRFLLIGFSSLIICFCAPAQEQYVVVYMHTGEQPQVARLADVVFFSYGDDLNQTIITSDSILSLPVAAIDSVVFFAPHLSCPDTHHPHAIDMGLPSGTLWSCCNVGAYAPEANGSYFAWGEPWSKLSFSWTTYAYGEGWNRCRDIGTDVSGTDYDTARRQWGHSWQMPSRADFTELLSYCRSVWLECHGVLGQYVIGPNGNVIFLPAAGDWWSDGLHYVGSYGIYWSASLHPEHCAYADDLFFSASACHLGSYNRYTGHSVRAVQK